MNSGTMYIVIFCLFVTILFTIFFLLSSKDRVKEKNLSLISIYTPDDEEAEEEKEKKSKLYMIYEKYYNTKFIQANLRITYGEFKTYVSGIFIVSLVVLVVFGILLSPFFSVMMALFIAYLLKKLPDFIIDNKKYKRKLAINAQKADILSIMSSCSSSQMPLDKTFKVLSERLKAPANEIFYEAYSLMKVGNKAEEVLRHLKKVFDSNDFNFLLSSYEVWLENQGSLQDTYRIVSISVRDKEEIDLHMSGLTSKTKSTLIMLVVISVFFIVLSFVMINDIFMNFAKSLVGQVSIIGSLFVFAWGIHKVNSLKNSVKY